jgi:hypothetical protein
VSDRRMMEEKKIEKEKEEKGNGGFQKCRMSNVFFFFHTKDFTLKKKSTNHRSFISNNSIYTVHYY